MIRIEIHGVFVSVCCRYVKYAQCIVCGYIHLRAHVWFEQIEQYCILVCRRHASLLGWHTDHFIRYWARLCVPMKSNNLLCFWTSLAGPWGPHQKMVGEIGLVGPVSQILYVFHGFQGNWHDIDIPHHFTILGSWIFLEYYIDIYRLDHQIPRMIRNWPSFFLDVDGQFISIYCISIHFPSISHPFPASFLPFLFQRGLAVHGFGGSGIHHCFCLTMK